MIPRKKPDPSLADRLFQSAGAPLIDILQTILVAAVLIVSLTSTARAGRVRHAEGAPNRIFVKAAGQRPTANGSGQNQTASGLSEPTLVSEASTFIVTGSNRAVVGSSLVFPIEIPTGRVLKDQLLVSSAMQWFRSTLSLPAPSPDTEKAYWEGQRVAALTSWRPLLFGIGVLNLCWWAADSTVYHGDARLVDAIRPIRIATTTLAFILFALLPHVEVLRRYPQTAMTFAVLAIGSLIAWVFSDLGSPTTLWFPLTFPILIIPTAFSFPVRSRALVMLLFGVCFAVAYYGRHPEYLKDPNAWTTISYLSFVVVVGFGAGLAAEYWRRDAFFLRLETERQARLLADLNDRLESRVAEQTSELRLLARNLETAREAERAHISRELHDELGQELTGLRYALKFTRVRYDKDPLTIRQNLENLQDVVNQLSATTRQLVQELRPKVLDDLGLVSALDWLARGFEQRTGTPCRLDIPNEELPIDREASVAAFRMVQEALTNIAKHAQARGVTISAKTEGSGLVICVQDDGMGFDAATSASGGGSGLIGMRERIRSVGGDLKIESKPGAGTTITARLNIKAPQELSA